MRLQIELFYQLTTATCAVSRQSVCYCVSGLTLTDLTQKEITASFKLFKSILCSTFLYHPVLCFCCNLYVGLLYVLHFVVVMNR